MGCPYVLVILTLDFVCENMLLGFLMNKTLIVYTHTLKPSPWKPESDGTTDYKATPHWDACLSQRRVSAGCCIYLSVIWPLLPRITVIHLTLVHCRSCFSWKEKELQALKATLKHDVLAWCGGACLSFQKRRPMDLPSLRPAKASYWDIVSKVKSKTAAVTGRNGCCVVLYLCVW